MALTPRAPVNMRVLGSLALQTGDTQPPTIPSNFAATAISAGRVDLSWTASTDNVGVAGYQVWRNGAPLNTTVATAYSDTTTQPSTTYTYTVSAFDGAGNNSGLAVNRVVTTPANAAPVWSGPGTQTIIVGNSFTLNLASFVSDADSDVLTFSIVSGTLPSGITRSGAIISGTPTTSGQGRTLVLRAADAFHTVDKTVTFSVFDADVTAPLVPTGLTATPVSTSEIDLSWTGVIDGQQPGTNTYRVNSFGKTYGQITNSNLYAQHTGLIITAQECHIAPFGAAYAAVRAGGGEVLRYIDGPDYYTSPGPGDAKSLYNLSEPSAGQYLWKFPTYGARSNFSGSFLADMSVGSAWVQHLLDYIAAAQAEGLYDGVYLDVAGARLFGTLINWEGWSTAEQNAWTDGIVDFLRRLDAWRRVTDPTFLIVANGIFDRGDGYANAFNGELYVDGVELEHSPLNAFHIAYAAKPFGASNPAGDLGHRRVLATGISNADALVWATTQGITHVDDQSTAQYTFPNVPCVGFNSLDEFVSGTKDYRIYRNGVLRATVTTTSYKDTGLPISAQYSYTVTARDVALNESAQSAAVVSNVLEFFFSDTSPSISAPSTGTTILPFTVTSSSSFGFNVLFDYTTQDGTAVAGVDYTATSGTATLVAGLTQYIINVPIFANAAAQPNKTFTMRLYNFRQG